MIELDVKPFCLIPQEINHLQGLAYNSFNLITSFQEPNGLIPASLGRFDDQHFQNGVWIKDHVRAIKPLTNPLVQQVFPELDNTHSIRELGFKKSFSELFSSATQGILSVQTYKEAWQRFSNTPGMHDENGYATIDCTNAPFIKFTTQGHPIYDWGHNQPDNWGILLFTIGKGIELDLPILQRNEGLLKPPGEIIQQITSYVSRLKTERLKCRSTWEHNVGWSSYSTRRIVLAGLKQIQTVWPALTQDSKVKNYPLYLHKEELEEATERLDQLALEHFPADYTDTHGHDSNGDLASLVVLHDIDLPPCEQSEIITQTKELEANFGLRRYIGDPWKRGNTEALWTMGLPIMACYYFNQSLELREQNNFDGADNALQQGLNYTDKIREIQTRYGYLSELFEDSEGIFIPNNNELAWTHGMIIEAAATGIAALSSKNTNITNQFFALP